MAGYAPLHTLLETIAIVISLLVFAVGWNAHQRGLPGNILLIACAFFGIGVLDFTHALSFAGMPAFVDPSSPEKAINFWLAARSLAATTLFTVAVTSWHPFTTAKSRYALLSATLILVGLLHWLLLFHNDLIPRTFILGQGLTPFKIYYEYVLITLNLATAFTLWMRMRKPLPFNAAGLFGVVCTMGLSEFFFTLYADVADIYNFLGHIYKVISYLFLYRAVFVETIEYPYNQLRESESLLRASERKLSTILDGVEAYIYIKDTNYRYQYANRMVCELFGKPASEIIGHEDADFFDHATAEKLRQNDQRVIGHGERVSEEEINTSADGKITNAFLSTKIPLFKSDGTIYALCGISTDITKHKQAEAKLIESEVQYRTLADSGQALIWATGSDKRCNYFNKVWLDFTGRTIGQKLDNGWAESIHPDDLQCCYDIYTSSFDRHDRYCMNYRIRRYDNEYRWIEDQGCPRYDANGNFVGYIGYCLDINERKQSEESLHKLSVAVEQSPNSVVITDLDAKIEYVNATFTAVTGYSLDEVIGKNSRIFQSGKTPKATYVEMWARLGHGEIWRGDLINCRKDGSEYTESVLITPVRRGDGQVMNYLAVKTDVTDKKKDEERIQKLANFDQLTGLPNRSMLQDRFNYALSLAQRSGEPLTVMFLDLDRFKSINDTLGHLIGDQLLMEVAKRVKSILREEDTVSRLGGDEFVLVLPRTDMDGATQVATKLISEVSQPYQVELHELIVTPSIGIAIYPDDGDNFETLSRNADAAMYRVKQGGRNDFRFYTPEMQAKSERNLLLSNALRNALSKNALQLHYQPQLSMQDGNIIGAEALLRWQHPKLGMISPAEFIPIAEDSGQITKIGEWVLRAAANQMKEWIEHGLPPMVIAVNLSAVQFRQPGLPELVTRILDEVNLPHEYLELELTEAVAMGDPLAAIEVMDKLYTRGIRMSIDDFGTGYSSLSYLKKFKVYKLKIDQSFVRDITDDPDDKAIVTAIINMASSLGIKTIAEGVETAGQLEFLRLKGCNEVQGYYFSKPLPAQEFEAFVKKTAGTPVIA